YRLAERGKKPGVPSATDRLALERVLEGGYGRGAHTACFRADGKTVLAALRESDDLREKIFSWDVASGQPKESREGVTNAGWTYSFSADGRRALVGLRNGEVVLWDVAESRAVLELPRHPGTSLGVALTPD